MLIYGICSDIDENIVGHPCYDSQVNALINFSHVCYGLCSAYPVEISNQSIGTFNYSMDVIFYCHTRQNSMVDALLCGAHKIRQPVARGESV